jgi:hypothetical protein
MHAGKEPACLMAADMISIAGLPPPDTAGAVAHGGASPPSGGAFADAIAAAMDPADAGAIPANTQAIVEPGIDFASLLAGLGAEPTTEPPSDINIPRPDRDAEAEQSAGWLAALLLSPLAIAPQAPVEPAAAGIAMAIQQTAGGTELAAIAPATLPSANAPVASGSADGGVVTAEPTMASSLDASAVMQPYGPAPVVQARPQGPSNMAAQAAAVSAPAALRTLPTNLADGADDLTTAAPVPTSAAPSDAVEVITPVTDAVGPRATERREQADAFGSAVLLDAGVSHAAPPPAPVEVTAVLTAADGPALASGLADTVHNAVLRGDHDLRIALNPPDLGHLTVDITAHESGTVTVSIHAATHEAHDLLQQQLPALRAGLEQREVRVERLHVEQQTGSAGLGWADSGGRQPGQQHNAWNTERPAWSPVASIRGAARAAAGTVVEASRRVADGRVDLRA